MTDKPLTPEEERDLRERHWAMPSRGGSGDIARLLATLDAARVAPSDGLREALARYRAALRVAVPPDGLDEAPEWYRRGWAEGHAAALAATEQPETGIDLGPMCRGGTPDGPCDDDFCPGPHGVAAPSDGQPVAPRVQRAIDEARAARAATEGADRG